MAFLLLELLTESLCCFTESLCIAVCGRSKLRRAIHYYVCPFDFFQCRSLTSIHCKDVCAISTCQGHLLVACIHTNREQKAYSTCDINNVQQVSLSRPSSDKKLFFVMTNFCGSSWGNEWTKQRDVMLGCRASLWLRTMTLTTKLRGKHLHWQQNKGANIYIDKKPKGANIYVVVVVVVGLGGGSEAYSKVPARGELALASFAQNIFF